MLPERGRSADAFTVIWGSAGLVLFCGRNTTTPLQHMHEGKDGGIRQPNTRPSECHDNGPKNPNNALMSAPTPPIVPALTRSRCRSLHRFFRYWWCCRGTRSRICRSARWCCRLCSRSPRSSSDARTLPCRVVPSSSSLSSREIKHESVGDAGGE